MRRLMSIIGLQAYAVVLAIVQSFGGVRTDEAKYLLDIPYPHPPLMRWLIHLSDGLPFQEMLWRLLLATAFIQGVWFVWDMGRSLSREARITLCLSWLLSAAVILQAGAVLLAPINALEGLVLVWFFCRPDLVRRMPIVIALFWCATLFTGYQGVLYLPIAVALFVRAGLSWKDSALYAGAPVLLLALYTPSNPLAMASIVHHGGEQVHSPWSYRLFHTVRLWLIGGSVVLSVLGTIGLFLSRRPSLILSFLLVFLFVLLNWFEYYSVLFTPLLVMGLLSLSERAVLSRRPVAMCVSLALCCVVLLALTPPLQPSVARQVMQAVAARGMQGPVLIAGTFGHEWQYESPFTLRRYREASVSAADAIVCLTQCTAMPTGWEVLEGLPVMVFVRVR